jgi:hypothetical protein
VNEGEQTSRVQQHRLLRRYKWLLIGTGVVVVLACGGLGAWWRFIRAVPLLPPAIVSQIHDFTPYFYFHHVSGGYTIDKAHISFESNILMVPLTGPNSSTTVVLTEQSMPPKLSAQDIQFNGTGVDGTIYPATINEIEGRLVGTMIDAKHRTLILISAPEGVGREDISLLLQGLKPLR